MAGMNVVAYLIMAGMKVLTRGGSKEEQGRMGGHSGDMSQVGRAWHC